MRIRSLHTESGFTFIEIIVAVTILSIIILTLYSLMDVGFSFWDYIDKARWNYSDIQLVVNRMEQDLHSTFFRANSTRYPFKGNMYQVEFYKRQMDDGKVVPVLYEYSPYDKALFLVKGENRIPLLAELERCNFYFYHPDFGYWDNYWDAIDQKKVPSAVCIEFMFTDSEDQYRYEFPIYIEQKGISVR